MTETLPSKENRQAGWPRVCLESWRDSFLRRKKEGGPKTLKPSTIEAIRHTLEMSLQYVDELEEGSKQ